MSSHDDGHVERVINLSIAIALEEGADVEIVKKAAELHDIVREKPNHAIEGGKMARILLEKEGYNLDFIENVVHCIEAHSFSSGVKPRTLEAKILSDADKLDAIGAVGIARTFLFSGEKGRTIKDTLKHFEEKLLKLKDLMETESGRKLAEEKHRFMLSFYERIRVELENKV